MSLIRDDDQRIHWRTTNKHEEYTVDCFAILCVFFCSVPSLTSMMPSSRRLRSLYMLSVFTVSVIFFLWSPHVSPIIPILLHRIQCPQPRPLPIPTVTLQFPGIKYSLQTIVGKIRWVFIDRQFSLLFTYSCFHLFDQQEEFLDVIYWGRQFFAIIIGIAWGYLGWTGFFGLASFAAVNSLIVYIYAVNYNEDTDDEMMDFLKEGFMTALSCFMVSWILTYSAVFHGEKFSDSVIFPSSWFLFDLLVYSSFRWS